MTFKPGDRVRSKYAEGAGTVQVYHQATGEGTHDVLTVRWDSGLTSSIAVVSCVFVAQDEDENNIMNNDIQDKDLIQNQDLINFLHPLEKEICGENYIPVKSPNLACMGDVPPELLDDYRFGTCRNIGILYPPNKDYSPKTHEDSDAWEQRPLCITHALKHLQRELYLKSLA